MTFRLLAGVSLTANLALAAFLFFSRQNSAAPKADVAPLSIAATTNFQTAAPPPADTNIVSVKTNFVPWALIESDDYPKYIANLRAVGCPERLIRDIIVADLDDLYQHKEPPPADVPPWLNADRRHACAREASGKSYSLQVEKRGLIKELLGCEWDRHAEEIWNEDPGTSLLLGFLPDMKATELFSLLNKYHEAEQNIRLDTKSILLGEDRAKLKSVYDNFVAEASQEIGFGNLEEYQLRVQAMRFFPAHSVFFDGMNIGDAQIRQIAQLSRSVKDMNREEFAEEKISAAELDRRQSAFEHDVKALLGPQLFAGFDRAQNSDFRELLRFAREKNLTETAATQFYDQQRTIEQQAVEVIADAKLSADQKATALAALKAVATKMISEKLGAAAEEYSASLGQWANDLMPENPQVRQEQ